jgi:hypothetical protein
MLQVRRTGIEEEGKEEGEEEEGNRLSVIMV